MRLIYTALFAGQPSARGGKSQSTRGTGRGATRGGNSKLTRGTQGGRGSAGRGKSQPQASTSRYSSSQPQASTSRDTSSHKPLQVEAMIQQGTVNQQTSPQAANEQKQVQGLCSHPART